jgi:hypothetical protein
MNRFAPLLLIPCVVSAACSTRNDPKAVGSARLTVTSVPPAVGCVELIAASSRTITASASVSAGETVTLTMNDIPAGAVTFSAFGFAQDCGAIAGAQPNWGSIPTVANIVPGQVASLQLVLDQVGGANVGISFNVDAGADLSSANDLAQPVVLSATPPFVDFGTVSVLSERTCTITNVGSAPLPPLQLQLLPASASSFFAVMGCGGATLAVGAPCTMDIFASVNTPTNTTATLEVTAGTNVLSIPIHAN